jgi:hypothetical protein
MAAMDRVAVAKRIVRDTREERGLSRMQMARMQGHPTDRLTRAWEDEDTPNRPPLDALLAEDVPDDYVESVFEKIRKARGTREPLGADSVREALLAVQRDSSQFTTWMATAGIVQIITATTVPQGIKLLERMHNSTTVALRFMRRITGAHAAAKGGAR